MTANTNTPPLSHGDTARQLQHCAIAVSDWLAEGCDAQDIPRPHIAALVTWTKETTAEAAAEAQLDHIPEAGKMVQPVAVPQGWKLVPLETTCEMNCAAFDAYQATRHAGEIWRAMLAAAPAAPAPEHPDDEAVDRFAGMLKAKLAKARSKGRSGWADPAWPAADINRQLHEHAAKGDPVDVAAYAMFLSLRGEAATGAPAPALVPLTSAQIEEGRREWLYGPQGGWFPSGFYAGVRFAEVHFGIGSKA